jgi:hypothetical protein
VWNPYVSSGSNYIHVYQKNKRDSGGNRRIGFSFVFPAAIDTNALVYTQGAAAFWARPARAFLRDKCGHSHRSDRFKILDHAHAVFCPIAFVNMLDARAWELGAFHTQPGLRFLEIFTISNAAGNTMGGCLFGIIPVASRAWFVLSQIGAAHPAIHATGSDVKRRNPGNFIHNLII